MNTTPSTVLAPPPCPAVILRPYQEACVRRVVAAYEQDRHGQELLVLPTAAGKTVIFSQVIAQLAGRYGLHALIVAHTDELLNQAAEKYRQVKPSAVIGKVGGGIHDYGGEVTVASVDTISQPHHLTTLQRIGYGLVVVDEAHRSAAPKYQRVLQALPEAFVLKVTATPDRLDGKPISDKPPLYSTDILAMIEQGFLCDVKAIAIRTETSLESIHSEGGDYREQELEAAIDTSERNRRVAEAYREHAMGRRAICFAVTVQHAHNLARAFTSAGIPAAAISGETSLLERKRLYHALRTGEVNVLCNVLVLTEGIDLPHVDCVIMARPTQSRALFIQCIGRGLRLAPTKKDCLILDLTDNCLKHRLEPQHLGKVLGKQMKDGETVLESIQREAQEKREREASGMQMIRRLKEKRTADLTINLKARLNWQEHDDGTFELVIGQDKHRILLVPSAALEGSYEVWAELAPTFARQRWLADAPLGWAQEHAERQARLLASDKNKVVLVDRNAGWRSLAVDPFGKQAAFLKRFGIARWETLTRGEASDILDREFAALNKERKRRQTGKSEQAASKNKSGRNMA